MSSRRTPLGDGDEALDATPALHFDGDERARRALPLFVVRF